MSTRMSIEYLELRDITYHLFHDGFDCWNLYLEIEYHTADGFHHSQEITIPLDAWRALRKHEDEYERYLDMPEEDMKAAAEVWIRDRIKEWEEHDHSDIYALGGSAITRVNDPIEKQIEDWIDWHTPPWKKSKETDARTD